MRPTEPPMGTPADLADGARAVHQTALEPGHRILLYTGGVEESRGEGGEESGLERFTEYVIRSTAAGQHASEVLSLLIHAVLDHQHNELSDDATIVLVEWQPAQRPWARAVTVLGPPGQVETLDGLAGAAALDRPGVDDPQR
ncbi:SpoIIE family protein phosphatase [Streptomyces spiralis]|uniref:SpoIIE family protein phosphatase n=1 Tax=Streptomyces spiralis TaxID=66376 RepID=UPI0035712808